MSAASYIVNILLENDDSGMDPKEEVTRMFDWREMLTRYGFKPTRCAASCDAMGLELPTTKLIVIGEKRDHTAEKLNVMLFSKRPNERRLLSLDSEQTVDINSLEGLIKNYLLWLKESTDSLEGVPNYDEFMAKSHRDPNSPEGRQHALSMFPPRTMKEARSRGVSWYVQNGRKYTFNVTQGVDDRIPFRNSATMATNRNARRKSFGYRDTFSMRERGWPTGSSSYRRADGSLKPEKSRPESPAKYEI